MIEIANLSKRYGEKRAVDGLDFVVQPGIVTGFLGPNGAGKSTTMRMIAGLDEPTAGRVRLNGRDYRPAPAPMAELGILLEAKAMHTGRSARYHLLALAQTNGVSRPTMRARCEAVMRSKWFMPLFCLGLGAGVFAGSWLGGHPGEGLVSLAVMAGFGLLLAALRSDTIRGLTFGRDERFAQIDLRATAAAGLAVITALIVGWLVAVAQGHTGSPYAWLAAIGGLAYIAAVAFFRWRS